jgi:hypothetical protein
MTKQDELTLKLSQKAENKENTQSWEKIKVEDRFYRDFFRGAGFKFDSSIAELIDNSISAGATKVKIKTELIGENLYNITIEDNGIGIAFDKIKSIMSLGSGNLSDYKSNSISYYGVGMKFAIINLSEGGVTKITSVYNGEKSSIFLNTTDIPEISNPSMELTKSNSGTIIEIPNICISSNKITALLKSLGVIYFPHIDNGNDLEITIDHNKDSKKVLFTDPFYRHINKGTSPFSGISCNDDEVYINELKISFKARFFDDSFNSADYTSWDINQGASGFSGNKSGVYFRLNGRYITLGENKFYTGGSTRSGSNRIRIEVEIDRDLLQTIGGNFNKSKIELSDSELLKPFKDKLNELITWAVKTYNSLSGGNTDISPETKEEREELNRDLNARRKKLNNDSLENAPELEVFDKEPKGTKKRPKIGKYEKHEKQSLNVLYESLHNGRSFDYFRQNGTLIIKYNTNHEFYSKYIKMPKESKKLIDQYTLALCDTFLITKNISSLESNVYESIIDELLLVFSSRLLNYVKD